MLLWTVVPKFLCGFVILAHLGKQTKGNNFRSYDNYVELFRGTAKLLSRVAALIHFSRNSWWFRFLHILGKTQLFMLVILVGAKWCIVGLICISLMNNDVDYLFICLLAMCEAFFKFFFYFLVKGEDICSSLLPISKLTFHCMSCNSSLHMFWLNVPCQILYWIPFSSFLWIVFLLSQCCPLKRQSLTF